VQPDSVVYNALITVAGRAGQLQRALEVVSGMEVRCLFQPQGSWSCVQHIGLLPQTAPRLYRRLTLHELCRPDRRSWVPVPIATCSVSLLGFPMPYTSITMTFNMLHHTPQENHCKPDAHTYAALIDACTRANKPDMALKVYGRAMASKVGVYGCDTSNANAPMVRLLIHTASRLSSGFW